MEWKPIEGFEDNYMVSNQGEVKSLERLCKANTCGERVVKERLLSKGLSHSGYYIVALSKSGHHKICLVHRLVAEAFLPNPYNKREVNHKDEDKLNNDVSNLEWCDRRYNANYGTGVERCAKQKFKAIEQYDIHSGKTISVFDSAKQAEAKTNVSRKLISLVCRKKIKHGKGFGWRFKNPEDFHRQSRRKTTNKERQTP